MDHQDFQSKLTQIQEWLKSVFGIDKVPPFEVNKETVTALHQIMTKRKQKADEDVEMKMQMVKETKEFIAEKQRLQEVMKELDLHPNGLSSTAAVFLKSLSKSSLELGTTRTNLPGLISSLNEFQNRFQKAKNDVETLQESYNSLIKSTNESKEWKVNLEKQYEELEAMLPAEQKAVEVMRKSAKFHAQKRKDYEKIIAECEDRLKAWGYSNKLSHDALVELGTKAQELNDRLKPFQLQLESYKSLPADINLARIKLQEKTCELDAIEEELHLVLQSISLVP
ncbi:HAUS augmin-like complex subunit 1 isoform X1 [Clavelina lepadiformis]|uniref:HAUS augmin-like complex subunit 1 isoform X1 n=2 Tax=Clavelina lepadiformis TaxID=159417 RepID=UPI004042394B